MNLALQKTELLASDGLATRIIRRKAKSMLAWGGLWATDQEDLEQELALAVVSRLPEFDRSRSRLSTFVYSTVQSAAANVVHRRRAAKRNRGKSPLSLDLQRGQPGQRPLTLAHCTTQRDLDRRTGTETPNPLDRASTKQDVANVLAVLPLKDASTCRDVMAGRRRKLPPKVIETLRLLL